MAKRMIDNDIVNKNDRYHRWGLVTTINNDFDFQQTNQIGPNLV